MGRNLQDMEQYWSSQSDSFLTSKDQGLGAVLYSGMPEWFNRFYDKYQRKAFRQLLAGINFQGKIVLDVGCGVGRWTKELKARGGKVAGIDFEASRLRQASSDPKLKNVQLSQMSATEMSFKSGVYDLVNSITVLQHLPNAEKIKAIMEMCRVTKQGGHIVVIELIDQYDAAAHVFPLTSEQWIREFEKNGCRLVKNIGNEYAPLPRALRRLKFALTKKKTISREGGTVKMSKLEWLTLRLIILLSHPIEAVCSVLLPTRFARHGGFLFEKLK